MKKRKHNKHRRVEQDIIKEVKYLLPDDEFHFTCSRCGDCCRHGIASAIVEPYDLFRIAAHMKNNGEPFEGIEDVMLKWTDIATVANVEYPVFMLKTSGRDRTCCFLRYNRCVINAVKPRVCRLYPIGVWPNDDIDDFVYMQASNKQHHYKGPLMQVKKWTDSNISDEEKQVLLLDARSLKEQVPFLRKLKNAGYDWEQVTRTIIIHKYLNYNLDEPFLPQFERNMERLTRLLERYCK